MFQFTVWPVSLDTSHEDVHHAICYPRPRGARIPWSSPNKKVRQPLHGYGPLRPQQRY